MQRATLALLALCLLAAPLAVAQLPGGPHVTFTPNSTFERAEDIGLRAHTNHLILVHSDFAAAMAAGRNPQFVGASPAGETPASLACVYKTVGTQVSGCPISGTTALPSGGSGVIAIVDAYHYATAAHDLGVFSTQFGLPACTTANGCFTQVTLGSSANCGWAQEAALDIEWAHAMAPHAKIVLVEAASSSFNDLFHAVDVATSYVTTGGAKGEVSMSWGGSEFSSETSDDGHFQNTNVVYFASSGDTGGANIYPSVSPFVVSAGGTSVNRSGGNFSSETAWSGSGGGESRYESRPSYQGSISSIVGSHRGAPDFSFDANPNTGVSVYDSTVCQNMSGWLVFGGTSVASPSLSGIVNLAGHFAPSTTSELTTIYSNLGNSSDFRDITSGTAGRNRATTGWDFVTGVGSDQGLTGK